MISMESEKPTIVDDFMYGSNVASAHIYIRMGFLRKVYGILSTQLLATIIVGAIFMMTPALADFVKQSPWLLIISFIGTLGILIALMVYRMETPRNYILLALFTLFESFTIGVVVSFYDVSTVLEAVFLTAAVTLALTAYTFQSKRDFSSWGAGLFSCLWILIIGGFLQLFFQSPALHMIMAIGGALLFSMFIIYDTHMLMQKHSPEEYIVAAINLYLDIINLFLQILKILAELKREH